MTAGNAMAISGRTGTKYQFLIVPRTTTFAAKPGVFVMARSKGGEKYEFCFVGETADLSKRPLSPEKQSCFNRFGVDHIFVLEEFNADKRRQVVRDIVEAHAPPCNGP